MNDILSYAEFHSQKVMLSFYKETRLSLTLPECKYLGEMKIYEALGDSISYDFRKRTNSFDFLGLFRNTDGNKYQSMV